jgi:putative tryptophan/tyrosine transport system substrate-binding protein
VTGNGPARSRLLRGIAVTSLIVGCALAVAAGGSRISDSLEDSPVVAGLFRWLMTLGRGQEPLAPAAQTTPARTIYRVGYLGSFSPDWPAQGGPSWIQVVVEELGRLGYVVGQNLVVDYRFGESDFERMPDLAADLVAVQPNAILLADSAANGPGRRATESIPLVQAISTDPVESGLTPNLSEPPKNVTGQTINSLESTAKRLSLLKSLIPELTDLGIIWRANRSQQLDWEYAQAAAVEFEAHFGEELRLHSFPFRDARDMDAIFAAAEGQIQAMLVFGAPAINTHNREIADAALRNGIPLMGDNLNWVQVGALATYAPNYDELYRRSAAQIAKILQGTPPSEIPFELPKCFDFAINLTTMRSLGRDISDDVRRQQTLAVDGDLPVPSRCTQR